MSGKAKKYQRIYAQLEQLFEATDYLPSRMATVVAVLHHKMKDFYWTGFYMLNNGELLVHNYQGPLACQKLKKDLGVCWASINQEKTLIVDNVHQFDGHIACSSLTNSEIVVPFKIDGEIIGCLDIDSKQYAHFDEDDAKGLEKILHLIAE
ncbi:GAF domain-containing protein [Balneicella halophila]|uniref:GAF domain-containing protein n=1 Tax=Balneicella halophila TaxID=1537566 RepID=A0A7L4UQP3_BALHA|nr:GAF domain-containing protein [Balneicella halophila]PVX50060.1 GAF domain-containing protein [Balneicella halophila]